MTELHSPIIGWAYDGNPIYGPYGYNDPLDQNSGKRILKSGYILDATSVASRPLVLLMVSLLKIIDLMNLEI